MIPTFFRNFARKYYVETQVVAHNGTEFIPTYNTQI